MKDAKSEAQKEIEDYRSQKETEFKSFETEVSGQNADDCFVHSVVLVVHAKWVSIHRNLNNS